MAGEEAVDEANLVAHKESEAKTDNSGADHEGAIQPHEAITGKGKGQGQDGGDEHHADDSANTENQQIKNRPFCLVNGAQDQQGDGGAARQTVDDADEQRAQRMKKPQAVKRTAQPMRRGKAIGMMVLDGRVRMPVNVQFFSMLMEVGVFARDMRMRGRKFFAEPLHEAGKIQDSEKNQHETHGKFHGQTYARGNHQTKQNDSGPDEGNGESVAATPQDANEAGFDDGAFAADDGGNGNDVIRVRGMTHPQEKSDRQDGKPAGQGVRG